MLLAAILFLELARALPPEYHSDLLLQSVETNKLNLPPKQQKELLEEVFQLAARAHHPFPTRGGLHTDTRAAVESADNIEFDRLSLRLRAVAAMLPRDPARATAMFRELPLEPLPDVTCATTQLPQFDRYYAVLARVFESGFTPAQRKRDEPAAMVNAAIAQISSPLQVEPAANLILTLKTTPEHRQALLDSLGRAIAALPVLPRVYPGNRYDPLGIAHRARRAGLNPAAFLQGLGAYLNQWLPATHCEPLARQAPELAIGKKFNEFAAEFPQTVHPIAPARHLPDKAEGRWDDVDFWQSPRSRQVLEDLRWLTHGNRDLPGDKRFWTLAERQTIEWRTRRDETLRRIEDWKESEEKDPVAFLWMKGHTLRTLAALTPPGPARDATFRAWLTHLEGAYQPTGPQNAWFHQLQQILVRNKEFLPELAAASNPVVAAYAHWASLPAQ